MNQIPQIESDIALREAPSWALLERHLFALMEDSLEPFIGKYTHPDGRLIWREGQHPSRDGADDFYESFYNWPELYLLGGGGRCLELGDRQWDATTRLMEEIGLVKKEYEIGYDQFHQSESYIYFYLLCMADPANAKQLDRARRFAGFYLNEDPEAINYDFEKHIVRAPYNGSMGPRPRETPAAPTHPVRAWLSMACPTRMWRGCRRLKTWRIPSWRAAWGPPWTSA